MDLALVVMVAIWIVIGLLVGLFAGNLWSGRRPLGELADYGISIVATLITGLADWYILPLLNIDGVVKFAVAIIEPPIVALFILWLVRKLKKTSAD